MPVDTAVPPEAVDLSKLDPILAELGGQRDAVIPILQRSQDVYGFLPRVVLAEIARRTRIPLHQLYGVATFYAQFRLKQRGKHLIRVCDGTACHVRGSAKNIKALETALGVEAGTTSADMKYSLEIVYCLGSCGLAPVAVVGEKVHGRLSADHLVGQLTKLT